MANASIRVGCKINVLDNKSKWHRKSGIVEKLIWQSMLDGTEVFASVVCTLDGIDCKVELRIEQLGLCE